MATTHKTIRVTDETGLPELLDDAAKEPIILERGGERFRLSRADDLFAGTITAEEAERLKEIVYRGREEGTRPIDRP